MTINTISIVTILISVGFLGLLSYLGYLYVKQWKVFERWPWQRMARVKVSRWQLYGIVSMVFLVWLLGSVALLDFKWGEETQEGQSEGVDVVFTLDVSQSMNAYDVDMGSNQVMSRLDAAKMSMVEFVQAHPEHRYALVVFAGEAFVSVPLTTDSGAFVTFAQTVDYQSVGSQGTDLVQAMTTALARFPGSEEEDRGRAMVVISDGGEEELTNEQLKALSALQTDDMLVFTVGVGGDEPVRIPDGQDVFGRVQYKSYQGRPVTTVLNQPALQQLARAFDGDYMQVANSGDLESLDGRLEALPQSAMGEERTSQAAPRYQGFLLASLLVSLLLWWGYETRWGGVEQLVSRRIQEEIVTSNEYRVTREKDVNEVQVRRP